MRIGEEDQQCYVPGGVSKQGTSGVRFRVSHGSGTVEARDFLKNFAEHLRIV